MDRSTLRSLVVFSIISACFCQHYEQQDQYYQHQHTPPPPQILSHKQAQNHDGNFKYAFAAENGLAQGETISPDGSRSGGYSYVDPHGKKISVKYTAGKEGFRILEGDHIPRPVAPIPQAHPGYAPQAQGYSGAYQQPQQQRGAYDDGSYKPEIYERPQPAPVYNQYHAPAPKPAYEPPRYHQAPIQGGASNYIEQKDYHDEPGKPHSFGKGYAFEFGG